ncbi:MAG: hypothetical protein A3J54_01940 [Candidatus Ryanbacteria bacterium RIFCSPHIGHO2_02_FULL_45_13b]|uniref:Uncharacterized protein n=1 Tax=Candidatus Ryanbacteria bacterium RIFCSPHIGHO2_02_FULL_45_13b TaxID=1802117 RepID=A0A1G2GAR7_9BACT|nr:MAG: hypothetical protein A3J54_01940 [Candidatus Ryanbacteria bacterium RIFCSPHIGHO2_02_FULL_45_13b]
MQKGFGFIGILIVVGVIAGIGAFVFTSVFPDKNPFLPSPEEKSAIDMAEQVKDVVEIEKNNKMMPNDDIADWKTYRNEEYGFEFKYPMDFKVTENPNFSSFHYCNGILKQLGELGPEGVTQTCEGKEYVFSTQVYLQKFDQAKPVYADEIHATPTKTVINGKEFYIYGHTVYTFVGWSVQTPVGESTLVISFSGNGYVWNPPNVEKISSGELSELKNILSTFKFTN